MAITRDRLQNTLSSVTLDFPDTSDTLTVWYAPDAASPAAQREFRRARARYETKQAIRDTKRHQAMEQGQELDEDDAALDAEDRDATFGLMLRLIRRWDYLEREPSEHEPHPPMVPITAETLDGMGWLTLGRIMDAITDSLRPNPTKSKLTEPGSELRAVPAPSRNGSFT